MSNNRSSASRVPIPSSFRPCACISSAASKLWKSAWRSCRSPSPSARRRRCSTRSTPSLRRLPHRPESASMASRSSTRRRGWGRRAMSSSGRWPSRSRARPIPNGARRAGDAPRERLAKLIARRIKAMLERGEILESRDRPVRPGDFLILVRHRDELVDALVRELKTLQVPVAGIDRMRLTEQLAVMDLIAFGQFLLLPEDDFNLAVLLKSPLFAWSEEQLFSLAHGRKGSLWEELRRRAEGPEAHCAETHAALAAFLGRADFLPPYELYAELLVRHGGRLKLLGRLGPEASDPVSEFMSLALAYEREHLPSLQGFLHWLVHDEVEIKRESEPAGPGLVRIMTVHGAKGLQAPIVFLPDTLYRPNQPTRRLWVRPGADELLLWSPR